MFSSSIFGPCQPNKSSSERSKKAPLGHTTRALKQNTEFPLKRGMSCRHHKEKKLRLTWKSSSCYILHQHWQISIWERKLKTKFVFLLLLYSMYTQIIQDFGELRVKSPSERKSIRCFWKRINSTLLSYLDLLGQHAQVVPFLGHLFLSILAQGRVIRVSEHSSTGECDRKLSWHYTGKLGKTAFAPLLMFLSSTFDLAQNYCRF